MALAIIINPVSGGGRDRGRERAARAAATLDAIGQRGDVFVSERPGHARELAAAAVVRGATIVASWGGDGTMNEVASALVGTSCALALVPLGSGNGLARTLEVATDPVQALVDACRASPRSIDAGRCGNGDWFFSVAGVGFDAHVAARFDRLGRGRRGFITYARVVASDLLAYRARRYRVDGATTDRPALLVTIANARQFGNGALIAPAARLDDGLFDVVVVEERSRLGLLLSIPRLFDGSIGGVAGVTTRRLPRVRIEDDAPFAYHVDGEPRTAADGRLELTAHPAVLRVVVR
ncbi:MAG: diacylglycerol kinase family protein [Vicinamibacterales bacterium]